MALVGHGRGTDARRSRAISARSAPRASFESFAASRSASASIRRREADFQLLRYAEHLLASAIGAASSRLVLSLLLRKRTVSTKAALKLLDDANAAIHYNREILQTALDHVRQGIAVFDKDLQLVCWNRQFGEILDLPPRADARRHRARRDPAPQRRAAARSARAESTTLVRERHRALRRPAASRSCERFAERGLVVEVRANRMPDGGIVTTFTDITPSVEAAEALERANETLERRVRERTERADPAQRRARRAPRPRPRRPTSPRRASSPPPATTSCSRSMPRGSTSPALVERQGSGEDARLVGNVDASLEAVEEILGALLDISRLDTGAMKPEIVELPHRRAAAPARGRVRAAGAREGPRAHLRAVLARRCAPTAGCCGGCCRTSSPTRSNTRRKGRVLVGCRRRGGRAAHRRLRHRARHSAIEADARSSANSTGSTQGAKVARGLGLGLSIVERIARVLDHHDRAALEARPRLAFLGRGAARAARCRSTRARASRSASIAASSPACSVLCIDNEPQILDGMETLLGGWGCRVLKAPDLATAIAAVERGQGRAERAAGRLSPRRGQRHRRDRRAAPALRRRPAGDPDHRRPLARACASEARARDIQVLNKPVKPAALRALIAQWRVQRVAAAE